ncbi:MAG TPA: Ig-like domain-containing protein [Thermoanaerobaculia bacterium]|jgi:hypothetical protein|nr:Ig-like domain-containing protein [Thermoanaerobaculia bacterium]
MSGKRSLRLLAGLWFALLAPALAGAADLANARLLIAGSRLTISPESQTVPFDTPTIIDTHIEGYDVERGVLPKDLRVVGDFTGPEVNGILVLETVPNQPFRIPRLRLEGQYRLDNIRLMQGNDLLAYAEPRSAGVLVTQVLITKVTSRALTLDEIRSYGIVVNDDSFQAFNFTFAFAVAGETVNYNIPVIYYGPAKDPYILWDGLTNFDAPAWRSSSFRFEPPRMAPFQLSFDKNDTGDGSNGGCESGDGDCSKSDFVPIPGVILFPTDVSLLHQFFSVMLIAQNGAPAGDRLEIHDLTAKVILPPGLRQAKTDPPTPLGVPVPVRVPGPDGILGTADDLTFLVAQASGQAEVVVEGLREGTHIVQFDLEGVLHGLPDGQLRRVSGTAKGAVIVRDPTLNVTISHPDTVRTDEEYSLLLTVTNTGTAPANLLKVRLPLDKLTGVEVVGVNEKTVTILPGDAELVEFRLRSKRTGRVVASAVRSSSEIVPTFELTVGVGENGIPLSPSSIILPRAADSLPPALLRNSLNLIGLGFSLATAPPSLLRTDLPRVSRSMVDSRVYQLSQAGRQVAFGEDLFDSAAELAAEWNGARDADWEWDLLRRTTQKGSWVGASLGTIFATEAAATSPRQAFERFAKTTGYLPALQGAMATGSGVSLEIASRTGGQRLRGDGNDATRLRELPFADLYALASDAQMAVMTVPEDGGYTAVLRASAAVSADLEILVPGTNGGLRTASWDNVSLAAGGVASVAFRAEDSSFVLQVDTQGDGTVDAQITGSVQTLQRRPFQALAAVLNTEVDPTGHVVEVLFTSDVDPASLAPADPRHFTIPNKVSNGGWVQSEDDVIDGSGSTILNPFKGMRNSRIIRVIFNNPLSPYTPQDLTVAGVKNPLGEQVVSTTVRVTIPSTAMPGTLVEGKVYGPDGQPVPFAEVELRESDRCLFCEDSCRTHKTAAVRADASGSFLFDYVRQTDCSDIYQLTGTDAATGRSGSATGRVRFIGQHATLNVVMLGRGTIRGRVTYDDGSLPVGTRVTAESPVFREGKSVQPDANGNYSVSDVAVGTITLSASDGLGRFVVKSIAVPEAGSVVQFDLVILRRPDQPVANGTVRGTIFRPDGTTPVAEAYVALYTDGNLVGTKRSSTDGTFDFGPVPAGRGEIDTFENQTGQSGVQVFFTINPDQVNQVNLTMRDQRGVVQGFVYKKVNGSDVPMFGVIVWAEGTPFKTVTDPQGHYVLEGVFAGTRNISAADLDKQVKLSEAVTIGVEGQVVDKNFYFQDASILGGIAGEVLGFDGGPVVGATVHLAADDQHWYRTATTDSSGRFTIPNLGVGGYGVHAFKGTAGGSTGALVRFVGDTPFVSVRFKRGSIHGVVQAENDSGQAVGITALVTYRTTAVRLELVGLDLEAHTITTAADGTWSIPEALVGPYVITVSNTFYGAKTVRGELVNNGESQTQNVLFERNITGTIKGRVLDQDGVTPVEGAHVELKHPTLANDMLTNAAGQFSFELLPPSPWGFPIDVTWENGVVFRKAEVWVNFSQKGQNLELEIVLPKQGSVSGRVSDANGVLVPGSVVTLQEGSYPRRTLVSNADADGNFEFHNIFAGTVTLSARAPSLGGLGGKTTVEIKADGEEVAGVTIFLEPTGKIQGRITNPGDGSPAASAQVQLLRYGGLFDSIDADADGKFEFDLLPMAIYDVQALDPRTGRHGRRNGLQLTQNNQVLVGDFQLETRGAVDGHLYEPGSTVAIPGATVRLGSNGFVSFSTFSSTGADGYFEFLGIPQGRFDLFSHEPGGRRVANGHGEIVTEGQRVTQDLFLERQGTVNGSVLNPLGAPDGVFPNANTVLQQDGLNVGATLDSTYSFTGVILGHPFWLETQEIGGLHRGETWGNLTELGPVRLDVRIHPIGSLVVNVRDSFGNPVNAATVEVINDGFYGWKRFTGDTGTDNAITFQGVGEGRVTAFATNPATGLRGSANGVLTHEGEIVQVNLALENSAQIRGTVVTADGTTPAPNALVALQIAGRTLTTFTNDAGFFTLPSVPMGSFLLVFQESFGPGSREIRGTLSTNGQILDLGTVVLDAVNPKVTEITPANGAVDLPLNLQAVVRFSEAMDPTRNLVGNVVHIETASGNWVGSNNTWIDGNTAIRIAPNQPLQNFTTYRIKVTAEQLFDVAGRRLDQSVQTSFTTADVLPPVVIEVSPANNAKQVSLAAQMRVMFNEPVDMFSLSGTHMVLQDLTAGTGVTTTFQLDTAARTVTLNPISALIDGHAYQLTLQGVADRVGNAMTTPFVTTFYTVDTTPPVISSFLPAEGATFTSGDRMTVSATVVDPAGVTSVALSTGRWVLIDNVAPYSWSVPVPVVASPTDVALQIEAVDAWGNHVASVRTIHVLPRSNTHAPQVTIGCLARQVVPGAELDLSLHVTDDERVESYKLTVNGTVLTEVVLADAADVTATQTWTVPAASVAGDTLTLHLEARDFAGNVASSEAAVTVTAGVALKGDRTLADVYAGQTLFLSKGTVTVTGPLHVAGLILQGATLKSPAGGEVNLIATGRVEIACGSGIDVSGQGYAAGSGSHLDGYAPAGVTGSQPPSSGGSHGGRGGQAGAGEVYDSVYAPRQGGGGGASINNLNLGSSGGGVVRIAAAEVELAGQILAKGTKLSCYGGSGGGGTVSIVAGVVSGAGSIDASGGDTCNGSLFAGGGGRVSVVTGTWNGFDPAAQVKAWGGGNSNNTAFAAPGTIYSRKTGDTYGALLIDAGTINGAGRTSLATDLPQLGGGAVTGMSVAGADLWLSAGSGFAAKWLGVWVHLYGAGGADLGAFAVAEIDGAGRLRLVGAAGAAAATTWQGEYRFDSIGLKGGAGIQAADPIVGPELVLEGNAQVSGQITATNVRVKAGAVVRPAAGGELRITTPGRLTIEAGARLDVTGLGYAAGSGSHLAGYAPDGVTGSQPPSSGGSHGGRGGQSGAGEVFDSVYAPRQAGGGGASINNLNLGSSGGGVVHIEAGEMELAGQIVAKGTSLSCYGGSGAGGTVSIVAGVMSGAGSIDASGADTCNGALYAGGGGRVSIVTGTWSGFDPATQVKAWGGGNSNNTSTFAAPGTIFYEKTGDTYGALLVDAGSVNGAGRVSLATELPVLGTGPVTAAEVSGGDLWVSSGSGLLVKWAGAWMRLRSAAGADLGAFAVAEIDAAGRARLTGASGVAGASTYQGEYRFDRVELRNGAGLDTRDPAVATDMVLGGAAKLSGAVTGATAKVSSGAVLQPVRDGELRLTLTGKLTVEAGATLDVTGLGYAAGSGSHLDGYAPAGVTGSKVPSSGGSHGGRGGQTGAGEVYDSVYAPRQAGGGGASINDLNPGSSGGGVVRIEAGEVELAGQILAKGTKLTCYGGSGAGGTVSIVAGVVSGTGAIDASGAETCNGALFAGGGGRVSIVTGTWNGFDPAAQAKAWGGGNSNSTTFAAPGTIYSRKAGDPYGALLIDAGKVNGADRASLVTDLPVLGGGAVTGTAVAGADLWLSAGAGSGFAAKWLGVWVHLRGSGGADLGAFSVAEIDGAGRLRLAGAAAVTGATTYQGEYRFDRVDFKSGAGLQATDPIVGPELVLEGNAQVSGQITATNVRVKAGAVVRPASGGELRITTPGRLTIEAGARLDVSGLGYAAGSGSHLAGYAPDGVTGSQPPSSGGSHGGRGGQSGAGEVFDSVYAPRQAGGGGASINNLNLGSSGGGVVHIEAGQVELAGQIVAKGTMLSCYGGSGGGGTVSIVAGVVSGAGSIDASGADNCNGVLYAGGGGRVSIVTGTWDGFDPAAQVKAWGGGNSNNTTFAAPGTIFYKKTGDTYGALLVDAGEIASVDRVSLATELPVLGTGPVTAAEVSGGDLWVSTGAGFLVKWAGAWMRLRSAAGADLGAYAVAEIDAAGRARLTDAAGVTGAAAYQGEYRFDRVELKNGAGVDAQDPLAATDTVVDSGDAELAGELTGATAEVLSGAVVRLARGGELRLTLTGKLTVAAGARLDVTGTGYAPGNAGHLDGYAPAGVAGSTGSAAGGSHGGRGGQAGAGEVYDSVYTPRLAGGGGAAYNSNNFGSGGGGVVHITAGELALAGDIWAKGGPPAGCYGGTGAGGTVSIAAGVVSGAGSIDASGADTCNGTLFAGGGGRVSVVTGTWNGFDPAVQVKAWGGGNSNGTAFAAPGTIFYKKTGDTYGALLVDAGEINGVDRVSLKTELPVLGGGSVTATAASGGDLWVISSAGFPVKWLGAWMRLKNAAGADLGAFAVADLDGGGRARLAGAAGVTGAAAYQGEYRFDKVEVKNGAGVDAQDPLASTDSVFDGGDVELAGEVTGATAELLSGAILRPARGSELRLTLTGKLTVATGARLDVTGAGYAAGDAGHLDGYAPAGVAGSTGTAAGGSHGGRGGQTGAGEVYDSLFAPRLPGGGGAAYNSNNLGSAGGGVVRLTAGEVALAGQIVARGGTATCYGGIGAGGTVSIVAGVVSGAGTIDASGGDTCNGVLYAGGGGRVSIVAGTLSGFDPLAQAKAWGGANSNSTSFASPGTVFYKKTGDTYGSLLVDQGAASGPVGTTVPPSIGKGIVGAVYTEPANATALWIEPQDAARKFDLGVVGLWVRVNGADYAVIAQSDDRRRLLLDGAAGAVSVGNAYLGIYKFDTVTVKGRATLQFADGAVIGSSSAASGSTLTLYDLTPPTVTVTQPAAGTVYTSGQTVQMAATVTDDRGVASVTFRLGDQSFVDTTAPYSWSVAAPTVTTEGDLPITVEAVDTNDNHTTATRLIHVQPLAPGAAPVVAFTCPTPGVLLAPGTGIDLNVAASHDNGIERVEFYQGATLLSTDFQAPFVYHFTVPAGATDGQVLTVTARAKSFTGTTADTTLDVHVVVGSLITADRTVAATDTSLDNTSVVVAGGTLTLSGTHTFRDLVVLDGAKVTHPETTSALESKLDLTVQRDLYVSCTGAVDVTGRGFLGSSSSGARAYGFGNVTTEGANAGIGGGYGGRGGQFDGSSPVYGSFYDPRDSGAGGGYSGAKGRDGGGIVRITATGSAVIDGSMLANGETGASGAGGAGGSIRLNAAAIRGAGVVQASGSAGAGGTAGAGSGGRIAFYGASIDSGLLGRTLAAGGKTSSTDPLTWGAAGTIFVKPDAQGLGDLILDNAGTASTQYTELLVVGHGIIDAVATNGFTDNEADFHSFLGAAEVAFNGNFSTLYTILGHSHHGTSLTLNVPTPPLTATVHVGDTYDGTYRFNSVTVRNGARGIALDRVTAGNTPGSAWTASYAPSIQLTSPAAGANLTSGTNFSVSASLQDVLGIKSVTFTFNGQSSTVAASPYTWAVTAPAVTQATDFVITATATDLSGNRFAAAATIHVQPVVDPNAPVVTLGACPANGDLVTPGVAVTIPFTATDDQSIQSYSLVVDGTTQQTVTANQATVSSSFTWTPPANAALGTTFAVRVEARDFGGGVGFATLSLAVPAVAPLTGTQNLTSARNGQALVLGSGTFTVQEPISLASLSLLNGAKVVGLAGQTLSLTVTGATRIQCGGLLDVSNLGYAGATVSNGAGGAPSGVTGSKSDSGGSYGGIGQIWGNLGPVGDVFGSVYLPRLGGGGGSERYNGSPGGYGGGTVELTLGDLVLNGAILAKGQRRQTNGNGESSGAGGSVLITATTASGAGLIDASGGDYQASGVYGASGGGGRVSLYVGSFSGFDPVTQVKAWGGTTWNNATALLYAGPGTVFVKTPSDLYGRLIVDSGKESNGAERIGPQTPLPALGTGAVTAISAQGSDALVTADAAFKVQWTGARMALDDASGTQLGSFLVLSIDGQGRALLKDASGASTAAKYRGQYRFDRLDVKSGAGVSSADEMIVGDVYAESKGRLPSTLTATNVTVKAGSPVTLAVGGALKMTVSSRLTVETGAVLDVTGGGYAGATASNGAGGTPAGVTGSLSDSGGSHGGIGQVYGNPGPAGEVFGSVYLPRLGGGGGSERYNGSPGGNGGGTVDLTLGELVLNGEIRAKGQRRQTNGNGESSGAGGSVLITAGTASGTGLIDASGGDYQASGVYGASGGGGRVSLYVGSFSGFDPATQVKAWGGTTWNNATALLYAGPGTVFVKTSSDTYGRLIVDSGKESNGTERIGPQTPLPALGTGTVASLTAQGADALVDSGTPFKVQWVGAWMALDDATGANLGSYLVLSIDAQGRALLKSAGTVTGAARYRGQYRLDRLDVKSGAGVSSSDEMVVGDVFAESKGRLPNTLVATNVTIKAGSPVTLAKTGALTMTVSGRLTVDAGAVLDVTGQGYLGATVSSVAGGAPSGVTGSKSDSGGSYGGIGQIWGNPGPVGDVFGSVYLPRLGGGGGSERYNGSPGGNGGGTVELTLGELVLNGEIRAKGQRRQTNGNGESSGAGGSVLITSGTVSGAGLIDASGGDYQASGVYGASGGGGRVALYVGSFSGFDPVAQIRAWGGTTFNGASPFLYGGPGTVLVKTASDTYGRLIMDSGKESNGAERVGPQSPLPALGTGAVTAISAQGADALVTAAAAFKVQWMGARMALEDAAGGQLGSFLVLSIDGQGRALLKDAAGASAAVKYRGQYRFDRLDVKSGAGVSSTDEVIVGDVFAESKGRLPGTLTAANVTIKAGSPVTLAVGGALKMTVSSRLTVETGAVLDVTGGGFAGATATNVAGATPAGVTGSLSDSGGSHGGIGQVWGNAGPAGEVFDSVYQPGLGGAGGSERYNGSPGGNGGGTMLLNLGELVLDGEIRAKGQRRQTNGNGESSGGGGSVLITAGTVSGAGMIDASGGDYQASGVYGASGGGGRVGLYVTTFSGFDPATQVKVRGGATLNGTPAFRYGSPGTVYVKLPAMTYGKLYVDQGGTSNLPIPNTPLPAIGIGTVANPVADTVNTSALWIEPASPTAKFALGAIGMWVRVNSTDYRVIDQSADRRKLLLDGAAGAVQVGDGYRGVYKFDEVIVRGGSKLEFRDTNAVGTFTVDATSSVIQNVP